MRSDRDGDFGIRPARDRHHQVQARRGDLRRGAPAGHQPGRSRAAPRRAGDRKRRGADSRRHRFRLRHRPAAQDVIRAAWPRRRCWRWRAASRTTRWAATSRSSASRKSIACSRSTVSNWRGCARSASTSPKKIVAQKRLLADELRANAEEARTGEARLSGSAGEDSSDVQGRGSIRRAVQEVGVHRRIDQRGDVGHVFVAGGEGVGHPE